MQFAEVPNTPSRRQAHRMIGPRDNHTIYCFDFIYVYFFHLNEFRSGICVLILYE